MESAHHAVMGNTATNTFSFITLYGSQLYFETNINGDSVIGTLNDTDTFWHHYIIIANGDGTVSMYQDGVELSTTGTIENDITFNLIALRGASAFAKLDIGRIQIYDHAFTSAEIAKY